MNHVARLPAPDRRDLFLTAASDRGDLSPAIIEKDFWVCWTLKQLFAIPSLKDHLLFKGGTSLSKVFGVIERFSEDIDLAVDWELLGYGGERDPHADMSRTRREKLLERMLEDCRQFVATSMAQALRDDFANRLGTVDGWNLRSDPDVPDALYFEYPRTDIEPLDYVRPAVVLELGTHAELIPRGVYEIEPYCAGTHPNAFLEPTAPVVAITATRTFWEKATILHAEHHRDAAKDLPTRHSRHYYDLAMMAPTEVAQEALADADLLERVVAHKQRFYPSAWARYDLAAPGSMRLVPPDNRLPRLHEDYRAMGVMIFGPAPAFDEMLDRLTTLEGRINDTEG